MSPNNEAVDYLIEQLEVMGTIRASRFFGGIGLACESVQFAMMMEDRLYFVVDNSTRPKYEQAGMLPFAYSTKKGLIKVKRYYEVPEEIQADTEQLLVWANAALSIARTSQKPKSLKTKLALD